MEEKLEVLFRCEVVKESFSRWKCRVCHLCCFCGLDLKAKLEIEVRQTEL